MELTTTAPTDNSTPAEENMEDQNKNEDHSESNFECSICLETAKDAVITLCGHLFWLACKVYYAILIDKKVGNIYS